MPDVLTTPTNVIRVFYLDRRLQPISRAEWWELLHRPEYAELARATVGRTTVVTAWRGLVISCERVPQPFVTAVRIERGPGRLSVSWEEWSVSEASAMVEHERALVEAIYAEGT